MTKKITEPSSPSNGIFFPPFPQNLNTPTEGVINDGVPETMKISIESFLPYIPKSKKPLEAPIPPLSTPRYTMENGHNFGRITYPSQAPTFGRKIKVPRGLPMAAEPVEFAFASEKQCKLPVMPSEAIFTAWKPIKPLRKSGVPLAKESDISFADASVSPEVVFVGARNNGLGGRGEVVDSEKLEDETASASSRDLARSLSIAIETPLPDDDELYSKDVPLTLSADAELDFKGCLQTSETGSPMEADDNKESLLVPPQDVAIVRSPDRTVSMRVLAAGPANWCSEDKLDVSVGNGQAQLEEEHHNSQHQAVQELDSTTEVNPIATESASGPQTLPLGAETCPEGALLILSLAVNTPLPPDTEFDSKLSALTSKSEADNEDKPQPETPQDEVIARSLGGNASTKAVFGGAGACGLDGEFEDADEVIGGLEGEATILKPHMVASAVTCEDLAHYLSIAVKTPLPDDAELCSEDGSFGLPPGFNTSLPVDTESDSESSLPILESEPPLEGVGHIKPLLEPLGGVGVAGFPNNALLSKDIFTVGSPTKQSRKHRALLAMEPEISFADTSVPREVIFGVAGTGGLEGVDEVNGELGNDVMESAGTPGITTEGGTSKFHCIQVVSSDSPPEDIESTLSIALKTPLPDDDEPCGGDASLTTPLSLNTPPIDTEFDTDCYNDPLKTPHDAVISRPPDSPASTEAVRTDEKLANPLCKSCALLANKTENLPDNPSVSWEAVSGGAGTGGRDGGDKLVDVLGDKITSFKGQIVSSSVISEDPVRYLSITVKIPLPDNPETFDENISLGPSLTFTGALPINTRLGSERQLSTPEIECPVEAGSDDRSLLEAPQNVSISRSPDSATSTGVLATELAIGGTNDKLYVDVGCEQEQLEEKHRHSQSQVIQEHSSPDEVIPIITESTPDLKDPFLHNTKPCSEDVLLALSLAANTPLPANSEFDSESHPSILEIKPPPETSDGNKLLLEAPRDVTATRLPGSTVSTEAVFTDGKPTKPLHEDCVPLAKKPETAFANVLTSPEVILGSVGANGLTGADEVTEEPEDEVVAFKAQIVSSNVSSRDLAHFRSLAIKTPLPDDELCSEDASLTHSLAVNTPLLADTESGSEHPLSIPETESPPGAIGKSSSLLDARGDVGTVGSSGRAVSAEAILTDEKPVGMLCQPHALLSEEPEIVLASTSVSPQLISGRESLAQSLAVNTPLPIDDEFDFEKPLSNLETKSSLEADDRNKSLLEAPQDVVIAKAPDTTISTEELAVGVLSGCSGGKGNQEKDIGGVNEDDQLENVLVHPYDHSLHLKDLNSTLEATAAITKSTLGLPLPSQIKTPVTKAEEYGHCKIFKSTVITPRTRTTTLCLLPSNTELSHAASSSTLSSHASTDTGEAGFSLAGFRETKLEYDLTDLFVGIFKEVGAVDLALSPCTSAGTTRPSSQDLPGEKKEIAASPLDASDEVAATSEIGKEKRSAVQKVFAKLRKASSVRKGAVKLFNKFSPMPVDAVE